MNGWTALVLIVFVMGAVEAFTQWCKHRSR